MLALHANNRPLDTHELSFTIVKKSFLDLENSLEGGFVFNFSIPATKHNNRIFDFPYRLSKLKLQSLSPTARIVFDGLGIAEGNWRITKATSREIQLRMNVDAGAYNNLIKGKTLKEIFTEYVNLGTTTQHVIDHANNVVQSNYPSVDYNFPLIYNPRFYGEMEANDPEDILNPDYQLYLNKWNDQAHTFIDNSKGNVNTLVPQFYAFNILKKCFTFFGYIVRGALFSNQELMQLMMYCNTALDEFGTIDQAFAAQASGGNQFVSQQQSRPVKCNLSDDSTYPNQDPNDQFNLVGDYFQVQQDVDHYITIKIRFSSASASIGFTGALYINDVQVNYGFSFPEKDVLYTRIYTISAADLSVGNRIDFRVSSDIVSSFTIEEFVFKVATKGDTIQNVFKKKVIYADHMPNIPISSFINGLFSAFGILPFFNHTLKTVDLVLMRDLLKSTKQGAFSNRPVKDSILVDVNDYQGFTFKMDFGGNDDLTSDIKETDGLDHIDDSPSIFDFPEAEPGHISRTKSTNEYYYKREGQYAGFGFYSYNKEELVVDNGSKSISIPGGLMMRQVRKPADEYYLATMPEISQPGTSVAYGLETDTDLRFFFWRGKKVYHETYDTPLAGTTMYDRQGVQLSNAQIEYRVGGSNGLVKWFYKDYIAWRKRRLPVMFEIKLTAKEIQLLELSTCQRSLELLYLISKVEIPFSNNQLKPARITAYTF